MTFLAFGTDSIIEPGQVSSIYNLIFLTNILRILDENGQTKSWLAKQAGISLSFLSDLTNAQANPSLRIMEAVAEALETPLAELLETTDLDQESLDAITGGKYKRSLPEGYVRVSATLTEFQAFSVRQWHQQNQKILKRQRRNR